MTWSWLLQHLISVTVLAAFVWLLCLGLKNRPAWRHALWLVVLVKLMTPAFVAWPWTAKEIADRYFPAPESPEHETVPAVAVKEPIVDPLLPPDEPEPIEATLESTLPEIDVAAVEELASEESPRMLADEFAEVPIDDVQPKIEEPLVERAALPDTTLDEEVSTLPVVADPPISAEIPADPNQSLHGMSSRGDCAVCSVYGSRAAWSRC